MTPMNDTVNFRTPYKEEMKTYAQKLTFEYGFKVSISMLMNSMWEKYKKDHQGGNNERD